MSSQLEAKKIAAELERKNITRQLSISIICTILCFIIVFLNSNYFKNPFLLKIHPFILLLGVILILVTMAIYDSYSKEDQAFLKIMESLELYKMGPSNPEILKHAGDRLEKASKLLRDIKFDREKDESEIPSWFSNVYEIEEDFIKNLRYRAVPAIRKGDLPIQMLRKIVDVFITSDIELMKEVNEHISNNFEIVRIRGQYATLFNKYSKSKLGKFSFSILIGYPILFGMSWIYAYFTNKNFYDIINNPVLVISGGIASSLLVYSIFFKE